MEIISAILAQIRLGMVGILFHRMIASLFIASNCICGILHQLSALFIFTDSSMLVVSLSVFVSCQLLWLAYLV